MTELQTMMRTEVTIDGTGVFLAPGENLDALKQRFEEAAGTAGTFVDFTAVGGRQMSVLISSTSRIVISVARMHSERGGRDYGDDSLPMLDVYDL